jgi:hypothetical protein
LRLSNLALVCRDEISTEFSPSPAAAQFSGRLMFFRTKQAKAKTDRTTSVDKQEYFGDEMGNSFPSFINPGLNA